MRAKVAAAWRALSERERATTLADLVAVGLLLTGVDQLFGRGWALIVAGVLVGVLSWLAAP